MSNAVDENGKATTPAGDEDLDDESNCTSSLSIDDIDEDEFIIGDVEDCREEDEEDDVEEDDDLEDEDDDDDNATYSTDASSTTSTSSTVNNLQDNTRVCDCCYCEVFGHGITPVAPTSRNFQEMRERLRKRLSKRRQERCQNDQRLECPAAEPTESDHPTDEGGGDDTGRPDDDIASRVGPVAAKKVNRGGKNNDKGLMGDSTIEEILNFINGTPGDKSSSKRKKDKSKSVNNEKVKSKSINATTTSSNAKESKYSEKCHHRQHTNNLSGNSHHNQGHSTRVPHVSPAPNKRQQQHNNTTTEQSHHTSDNQKPRRKANSKSSSEASTSQSTCSDSPNDDGLVVSAKGEKHRQKKRDKEKLVSKSTSNNIKSQQHHNNNTALANGPKCSHASYASIRESSRANSSSLTTTVARESKASNNQQQMPQSSRRVSQHSNPPQNLSSCDAPQQATTTAICQRRKQEESFQTSMRHENPEDHVSLIASAPDDVFKPRDIDLDDDRLDEFERELEAFKRFCLDSIPLVKKERVRIQLKDTNCFQEFKDRPAIKSKLPSDRRTKRGSPQTQSKRANGQYLNRDAQNFRFVI